MTSEPLETDRSVEVRGNSIDARYAWVDRARLAEVLEACGDPPRIASADFRGARIAAGASFHGVTFEGDANFSNATFEEDADFAEAVFSSSARMSRIRVGRGLSFRAARFDESISLDVEAQYVALVGTAFRGETTLVIRRADIALDEAEFSRHSTLWGVPPEAHEPGLEGDGVSTGPRLLSMRRASVAGLELSHLNVDDLWFAGVLGLEALAFLESIRFPETPKGRLLLLGRRTRRQTIADEQDWRARRSRTYDPDRVEALRADPSSWSPAAEIPAWLAEQGVAREEQPRGARGIASLYRALRKSHEDFNNYPDAADFYYGEMEMRRHGVDSRSERFILTAYWALSGYGLRPSRAFIALAVMLAATSLGFQEFGLEDPDSYLKTLATTIEFGTSLLRAPTSDVDLTTAGRFLSIAVRLLGPILIGLAALALRSRVKRG